jgi:hypothetical protein
VTRIRGRRHKQLLDDLTKKSGYRKLKEEATDITLWRTRSERGCGPVARHDRSNDIIHSVSQKSLDTGGNILNIERQSDFCVTLYIQ